VSEGGPMLPEACLIALVSGDDHKDAEVPTADYVLQEGDSVVVTVERA